MSVRPATTEIWGWLDGIPDPEIPVISVVDLGIVRDVRYDADTLIVAITPTYSGCPATSVIAFEIDKVLRENGIDDLRVTQQISPPLDNGLDVGACPRSPAAIRDRTAGKGGRPRAVPPLRRS